ncbi:MAG: spore coat associated protein CotJA [Agathobacter sp.]|nr:spore coat associated protein CotJA [Agathobacter sp.]
MNLCDDCGNARRDELRGMPLAMGYVPWQNFGCTFEPMEGLHAGTIFPELEKPFYGRRGMR